MREGFHAQHAVGIEKVDIAVCTSGISCRICPAIGCRADTVGSCGVMRPPGLPSQVHGYGKMMARDEVVFVAAVANGIHFNSISPAG